MFTMINPPINELLEKGMNVEKIMRTLANENWGCFMYFKTKLKKNEEFRPHYRKMLPLINDLIQEYEPS